MLTNPTTRSCALMALSMAGFTINDAIIKTISADVNPGQIMFVRGIIMVSLLVLLIRWKKIAVVIEQLKNRAFLLRVVAEAIATVLFLIAIAQLPLANVSAILQALPLAVTLGAALVFKQTFGWRRMIAILAGFCGVLLVVRPGFEGFNIYSLLVLGTVCLATVRDLATRALPAAINSLIVTTGTAFGVCVIGAIMIVPTGGWQPMGATHIATLAVASLFLFAGYQCLVLAMRTGDIATVAPFRYTGLLWAIVLGYIVFDELPDLWTLVGSAIIVVSGLYALYRDHLTNKALRKTNITSPAGRGT